MQLFTIMFGDVQFSTFKTIVDINTVRTSMICTTDRTQQHCMAALRLYDAWLPCVTAA